MPKSTKGSVIFLIVFTLLVCSPFFWFKKYTVASLYAQTQESVAKQALNENQALKDKLQFSATIQTPEKTKQISRMYIQKYFGKDAAKVEATMTCESGLNNLTYHQNREGLGYDAGLYQINSKFHKARFEKMYGVPFEVGAYDFDLSSKYAKYLFDNSKGLSPWVCNAIIENRLASK